MSFLFYSNGTKTEVEEMTTFLEEVIGTALLTIFGADVFATGIAIPLCI
ncbi:hypothetical protein [Mangrovibacillus cuniculi]|uniref:Uncharacterized protein n=1 Tax=Mangrovibacillus cuniculi TaxID=2593652 RepID=A0A7S8HGW1_9BACI|nr:hypothetical protein [Mangrovibacillus cuniculi]QPC47840.1 hypothetical protein G8O30_13165 [Mangrovibacillus cuniculi]